MLKYELTDKDLPLLTFEVEKEYMKGETRRYPVNSDGTKSGDSYDVDSEANKIVLGFVVNVYRGQEHIDTQFYPVRTTVEAEPDYDDTDEIVYKNNEAEVLAEIARHYPPEEYQNYNW